MISKEVRKALFYIGNDKTPRPDEYGVRVFKTTWDIVNLDLQDAAIEFFTSSRLLRWWNHTLIILVPKVAHASLVTYRPISCYTVVYKVISKVLATRLVAVIDSLLDPAQVTFVQGKSIIDHIHLI